MGMIGRWIDEACQREPEVMRRVLGRRFGALAKFITEDRKCGCLIGSWGLERGARWTERRDEPPYGLEWTIGYKVYRLTTFGGGPKAHDDKRPDAFVIRLLKQRIRKALGLSPVREAHPPRMFTAGALVAYKETTT